MMLTSMPCEASPMMETRVRMVDKEQIEVFWTWKKVALLVAVVLAGLALGGHFGNFLPPAAVYSLGGASGLIIGTVAIASVYEEYKKRKQEHFSWEDIMFFTRSDCNLGFRYAGTSDQAEWELKQGFWGNSLNLNFTIPKVWKKLMPEDRIDPSSGRSELDCLRLWPGRVSKSTQNKIIQFLEDGIESFIKDWPNDNKAAAFLLIDYEAGECSAYDLDAYGQGLGKKGNKDVSPAQIKALIPPPPSPLAGKELIKYYRIQLIKEIRLYGSELTGSH